MKDKRYLLRLSGIISIGYTLGNIFYNCLNEKINDAFYSELFLLIIAVLFSIYLIKVSFKSIKYIKKSVPSITIASIYLLFMSLVPGILGFVFIHSLKEKKAKQLPLLGEKKITTSDIIISLISMLIFVVITFIFPSLGIKNYVLSLVLYLIVFVVVFVLNIRYYINDGKVFIKNLKLYIPFIIKRYLIMFVTYLSIGILVSLLNGGGQAANQKGLNDMFKMIPIVTALLSCIYAPIIEETIFRLDGHKLINNKYAFIIISGLLFGIAHIVNNYTKPSDILYTFVYGMMGLNLAKAYYDSKNIFVSISMHFMQNTLAIIVMFCTLL